MGGGDVMGAQIEELRRSGAEKSAFWGSVGRIGGGILGGVAGTFIMPGAGTAAGAAAGVALGSTLFGAAGDMAGIGDEKKANEMATSEAYAKLWERQAPSAMELTALLGKYGGTSAENTRVLRNTWENAVNTATEYGFSPEEGVEQVKQMAYQGLNEKQSLAGSRDVFAFERGTGADRGALAEFRSRTERFGGGTDGLNKAWQGNQASGMAPAQFNEFLRAMQRTFEDGISKGFVRGAGEIAGNLSFLSDLNGGSELWKGEQGAARLLQMSAGVAATTGLASVSDILSFRGAQKLLKQWDAQGDAKERWKSIGDLDPKKEGLELKRGYDYIDAMAILERGLTPELFHSQMQMIEGVEGSRTGRVEQMKNIYGLNYTGSAALYQVYEDKKASIRGQGKEKGWSEAKIAEEIEKTFSGKEWAAKLDSFQNNTEFWSKEIEQLSVIKDIQKYISQTGQQHFDTRMDTLQDALVTAFKNAGPNTSDTAPGKHSNPSPEGGDPGKEPDPSEKKPYPPPTPVEKTLEELKDVATAPPTPGAPTGDITRTATNNAIAAQMHEGRRLAEIDNMLKKDAVLEKKRSAFFTDSWDGFGKDDPDEAAYKNLQSFGKELKDSDSYKNYWKSIGILETFTDAEREYVNKNNNINTAINDAMTDKTGQRLVELLTELRDNTKELHIDERP
jgi:hypothetical protein